jgi:hypothetical protein
VPVQKLNNLQFSETYGYKKDKETTWYFLPLHFFVDAGSNIWDPVSGMEKSGSRINQSSVFIVYFYLFILLSP